MRDALDAVVLGGRRGGADQHVAQSGFADVGTAMIGGEALDQRRRISPFAVHEDVLMRHEHVFKDDQRFLAGELRIAGIHRAAVDDAGVVGLAADDVSQPRRIDAHRADHRPVAVGFGHAHGRHEDQPMRIDRAGLVHLGARDVDAFVVAPHHMQEQIGIALLMRRLGTVAFRIGHGAADDDIRRLRALEESEKAPVIIGAVAWHRYRKSRNGRSRWHRARRSAENRCRCGGRVRAASHAWRQARPG